MKKLLSFMLIIGIFALHSPIMGMGWFKKEQKSGKKNLSETIFEQIDAAKKDGDSDIENLKTNLTALLATENNDALIDVLKKMKDTLFYYVIARGPVVKGKGTWHGKELDKTRFKELEPFFYNLIFYAKNNFKIEQRYQTIKIFEEIIQNIDDEEVTKTLQENVNDLDNSINKKSLDWYKVRINDLINPSELDKLDTSSEDDKDSEYAKYIKSISNKLQELLINSAGYSKTEAEEILKYTLEDYEFIKRTPRKKQKDYFDFLQNFLIALGDKDNLNNFAKETTNANEKFRSKGGIISGEEKYIPAYQEIYIKLLGGQEIPLKILEEPESDLGTALTQLSVELTALNTQLPNA